MAPQKPRVLMIIDVQRGFIVSATRHVPAAVEALQDGFGHVFVTRFENPPDSPYHRILGWQGFAARSPDCDLAFTPRADAVHLSKSVYSALTPGLLETLAGLGADTVYLAGIATDNCILKTAADLFEAGVRPVVLAYACASHGGAAAHAAGIRVLKRLIGAEQVVEEPIP